MNWLLLVLAGLVEVAWSQSIRPTENFTRPLPTAVCCALMLGAVYLLSRSMETIPTGTAYAVFTGIGAAGAVTLGIVLDRDPVTALRMTGLALIVGGIVLVHAAARAPLAH